jgi:hypothetical protein
MTLKGLSQKCWQKFTELDLTKGRGGFLNFLGAKMILKRKKYIYCGKCQFPLAQQWLAAYFS